MPRQVDHRSRRAAIAEAAWRLTARDGLEAVSMRHVAAAAGVSLGQVQHYFASKDELLRFALELVSERVANRIAARAAEPSELEEAPGPRQALHRVLIEMLPLDADRTAEAQVGFAYLARAAVAPRLAEVLRAGQASLHEFVVTQLERGQREGTVPLRIDPHREARTLLAVVDGLTAHVLIGHHSAADAEQALDTHLDELFSG